MLKSIVRILLLFLFVFGIPFQGLPINSSKLILVLLVFSWSLLGYRLSFKINKEFFVFVGLFLTLSFLAFLYATLHNTEDYSISYAFLILVIEGLIGSILFVKIFYNNASIYKLLYDFVMIGFIQGLIILMMFLSEMFRNIIYSLSKVDAAQLMERYDGFRGFGLSGSVTYDLAVILSIDLIFLSFLIIKKRINILFSIFAYIVIIISILMSGRTGWVGIGLSFIILLFDILRNANVKIMTYLGVVIIFILTGFPIILQSYYPEAYDVVMLKIIPYAFEMFVNYFNGEGLSTHSSDILQKMYFPISEKTFLFGDGFYKNPANKDLYYMGTDAGYMRQILFYGIFPSLLLYMTYLYGFYRIYVNIKFVKGFASVILLLCGYYFLVQYKGAFLTGSPMNIKIFCLLLCYSIISKKYYYSNSKRD